MIRPKNHTNEQYRLSIPFFHSSGIYWAPTMSRQCTPCWGHNDEQIRNFPHLHGMYSPAGESKLFNLQNSDSFKVPTNRTWPPRPRMLLPYRTSFCRLSYLRMLSLPGCLLASPILPITQELTYSRIRALLNNDRVAFSRNPDHPDSYLESRAVIWNFSVPPFPVFSFLSVMPKSDILFKGKNKHANVTNNNDQDLHVLKQTRNGGL